LWRVFMHRLADFASRAISLAGAAIAAGATAALAKLGAIGRRHMGMSPTRDHRGVFARTWPIGTTALWIAILLSAYLLAYFVS